MRFQAVLMLAASALCLGAAPAAVRVTEGTLTLPTYLEGPPDPNPPFDIFETTRFNYPYTMRENLTGERKEISWRALYLENEYLKCSVLPDIGGHVYTCIDKISGQPMFYANPSIKKAKIGYRGAWAAFGIEFNFPVSHNWVSMSPVNFTTKSNPDGSASIFVSNIDRPYGMQWTVELRLRPASTVLEEHVTLYNRSDVRHRFYWWNNAGVRVWDDSRICYPMRWTASHGFTDVDTWPVDHTGKDLSIIRNHTDGPVSRFVYGSREPFMGVYHPHTETGVAHYADYGDLPGKKIWSWGVDADGLDWRRALSDDNSAYVEVQAGPMRNQETYAFLEPRQTIRFTEYWMPVRAIGGIARANLNGVLNLERRGSKLYAGFDANEKIDGARIRILDGATQLFEATADLAPERTWSHEIDAPQDRKLTFELRASDGRVLMRQTEGEYDWSPASEVKTGPQRPEKPSGPLDRGRDEELNGRLLTAYDTYTRALESSPNDFELRVAAGRLAATLLRYEDAIRWLEPAQAHATYDPEIAYYLGIAYDGAGRERDARTEFETAQRMPLFHAAGAVKLAELVARQGDLALAAKYLNEVIAAAPGDQRAMEELAAVDRALKRSDGAPKPPISLFLSNQTGSDPVRVLKIASEYMRLGLWRDALAELTREYPAVSDERKEPGAPLPQDDPVVAYYRGFCRAKLGESPAADYAAASRLPTAYVFPDGAQTLAVLEAALRANPNDATAHFLLGSMRLTSGYADRAITEWTGARKLNPAIPVLHADLGRTLLLVKHEPQAALEAFREGLEPDPKNADLYAGIDQASGILGHAPDERVAALERYPDRAHMPAALVYELALNHAEASQFDRAKALFKDRFFPREEGGINVRQVWIRVRALEAQWNAEQQHCDAALAIADHLGDAVAGLTFTRDGLTHFIALPPTQAVLANVEARCGRTSAARERVESLTRRGDPTSIAFAYQIASRLPDFNPGSWTARLTAALDRTPENYWIGGLLDLELGRTAEGHRRMIEALYEPDRNLSHHYCRMALKSAG